jgi:hypothetical protein
MATPGWLHKQFSKQGVGHLKRPLYVHIYVLLVLQFLFLPKYSLMYKELALMKLETPTLDFATPTFTQI